MSQTFFTLIRHTEKCVFVLIVMLANHCLLLSCRLLIGYVGNVILFSSGLVQKTSSVTDAVNDEVSIKYSSVHYLLSLPVSSACIQAVEYMTL